MNTFAWTGVIAAGLLIGTWIGVWLWSLLREPIGRELAMWIGIVAVLAWGVAGGLWLLTTKG